MDLEKIKVYTDEMKDGFKYFRDSITANCTKSWIERVVTTPIGLVGGGLLGALTAGIGLVVASIAAPAMIVSGALAGWTAGGVVGVGSVVGTGAGYAVADFLLSDIWQPSIMEEVYVADPGHFILEDPTFSTYGQGSIKIISRDEKRIKYVISATQGTFEARFTIKMRWIHKADSGEFEYPKSFDEYMNEVR